MDDFDWKMCYIRAGGLTCVLDHIDVSLYRPLSVNPEWMSFGVVAFSTIRKLVLLH